MTEEEIHRAIKNMGPFKAPGVDGFQAIFFQSQWKIMGKDFCSMIKGMFQEPAQIGDINDTLITLIPKVENVTMIKDLRPISLCNVSYRVITKIIAERLKGMMSNLVSPCQCSFIPNRHSGDNIIIAQEVFHLIRTKKGNKGWMALKIDLEKAYDRVKLEFIRETLLDTGCPRDFVNLVWNCISSPSMKVLWHGEALDSFKPERGVRQGDPLSTYLLVLSLECLFHLISLAEPPVLETDSNS